MVGSLCYVRSLCVRLELSFRELSATIPTYYSIFRVPKDVVFGKLKHRHQISQRILSVTLFTHQQIEYCDWTSKSWAHSSLCVYVLLYVIVFVGKITCSKSGKLLSILLGDAVALGKLSEIEYLVFPAGTSTSNWMLEMKSQSNLFSGYSIISVATWTKLISWPKIALKVQHTHRNGRARKNIEPSKLIMFEFILLPKHTKQKPHSPA